MIEIRRGDTIPASIQIYYSDGETPMNLTDRDVYFTVKERVNQPDDAALISLSSINEINISEPSSGICKWVFKSEHTEDLMPGKYYFDVKVVGDNQQLTVLYGDFVVNDSVKHHTEVQ